MPFIIGSTDFKSDKDCGLGVNILYDMRSVQNGRNDVQKLGTTVPGNDSDLSVHEEPYNSSSLSPFVSSTPPSSTHSAIRESLLHDRDLSVTNSNTENAEDLIMREENDFNNNELLHAENGSKSSPQLSVIEALEARIIGRANHATSNNENASLQGRVDNDHNERTYYGGRKDTQTAHGSGKDKDSLFDHKDFSEENQKSLINLSRSKIPDNMAVKSFSEESSSKDTYLNSRTSQEVQKNSVTSPNSMKDSMLAAAGRPDTIRIITSRSSEQDSTGKSINNSTQKNLNIKEDIAENIFHDSYSSFSEELNKKKIPFIAAKNNYSSTDDVFSKNQKDSNEATSQYSSENYQLDQKQLFKSHLQQQLQQQQQQLQLQQSLLQSNKSEQAYQRSSSHEDKDPYSVSVGTNQTSDSFSSFPPSSYSARQMRTGTIDSNTLSSSSGTYTIEKSNIRNDNERPAAAIKPILTESKDTVTVKIKPKPVEKALPSLFDNDPLFGDIPVIKEHSTNPTSTSTSTSSPATTSASRSASISTLNYAINSTTLRAEPPLDGVNNNPMRKTGSKSNPLFNDNDDVSGLFSNFSTANTNNDGTKNSLMGGLTAFQDPSSYQSKKLNSLFDDDDDDNLRTSVDPVSNSKTKRYTEKLFDD